ncbi:MAG: putative Ig domain-containing protein [Firmicutes bacterium]|nr:putative Ig domain-containing protein [Bacillota bacterium]
MKKKIAQIAAFALCCLLVLPFFASCASCSGAKGEISYAARPLDNANVGQEYFGDVAFAVGTDNFISYRLAEGSSLPDGLSLKLDGSVVGVPKAKASGKTFTVVASADKCTPDEAEFTLTVEEGWLSYGKPDTVNELRLAVGRKSFLSIAFATGAGGDISYDVMEGEVKDAEGEVVKDNDDNPIWLPTGLMLMDGIITDANSAAIETRLGEVAEFKVRAISKDCALATGSFKLSIVQPWLELSKATLPTGRVGEPYAAELPAVTGIYEQDDDVVPIYELKEEEGNALPEGLTLEPDGLVWGDALGGDAGRKQFKVVVSAPGSDYSSAEATFTMPVRNLGVELDAEGNPIPPASGTIQYKTDDVTALPDAFVGEPYGITREIADAVTDNLEIVRYYPGENFPEEFFTIYPSGLFRVSGAVPVGALNDKKPFEFKIVAKANGCPDVTARFTLKVNPVKLKYKAMILDSWEVGTALEDVSVGTAITGGGGLVTYKLKPTEEGEFPNIMPEGLTLNPDGSITGTPAKSAKRAVFTVVASAENYSDNEAEIYVRILDAITVVGANGTGAVFEAEYVNLEGKNGSGWSGSASEEAMIMNDSSTASNGMYVGWLNCPIYLDFEIYSDKAVTGATLIARLGDEFPGANFRAGVELDILVNGVKLSFSELKLSSNRSMSDYTIGNINLVEGLNVIRFQVLDNAIWGDRAGGPAIDCIKINNYGATTTLSWRPYTYNTDWIHDGGEEDDE